MKFYKRIEHDELLGLIEYYYGEYDNKVVRFTPKLNCLYIDHRIWVSDPLTKDNEIHENEYYTALNNFLNQTK